MRLTDAVGKRIADLLEERNMTQYALSTQGGIPRATISVIIAGKPKTVKLDTVYQIAATLGMSLEEFFADPMFNDISD